MKTYNLLAPIERFIEKELNQIPPEKLYPRFLAILITLGYLPLLIPGVPEGHDIFFHIARLITHREGFLAGDFLQFINYDALAGFGYGYGLTYSDLYIYPFGLLAAIGIPIITVYKLFLFICGILTAFSMYHVAKTISGKPFVGFAAALLYTWSSYYAVDVFRRSTLSEVIAFIFVPWCILGLWNALYDESPKRSCLPLALGYAGLFYAHSLQFIIMAIIGFLITAFNLPALLRDIRRIGLFFRAGCLALSLAAFFATSLLEQIFSLQYKLTTSTIHWPIAKSMMSFPQLFLELPQTDMEEWRWLPSGIGIIFVIIFLQRLRLKSTRTPQERFRDLCMITGFVSLISICEFVPWQGLMRIIAVIQFPWRLFLPATAFSAVGGALLLGSLLEKQPLTMLRTWLWILLCGCAFPWWSLNCYHYASLYFSQHMVVSSVSREEAATYIIGEMHSLPQGKTLEDYEQLKGKAPVSNPNAKTEVRNSGWGKLEIDFSGFEPGDTFEIPRVYYKGYQVETPEGGVIDVSEQDHFRFRPNASSGTARVVYRMTPLHKTAFCISVLTLAGLIVFVLVRKKKQRIW